MSKSSIFSFSWFSGLRLGPAWTAVACNDSLHPRLFPSSRLFFSCEGAISSIQGIECFIFLVFPPCCRCSGGRRVLRCPLPRVAPRLGEFPIFTAFRDILHLHTAQRPHPHPPTHTHHLPHLFLQLLLPLFLYSSAPSPPFLFFSLPHGHVVIKKENTASSSLANVILLLPSHPLPLCHIVLTVCHFPEPRALSFYSSLRNLTDRIVLIDISDALRSFFFYHHAVGPRRKAPGSRSP